MGAPRSPKRKGWPPNLYQQPSGYFYFRNPYSKKVKGIGTDRTKAFSEARAANAVLVTMHSSDLAAWVSGIEQSSLKNWTDKYLDIWQADEAPAVSTLAMAKRYLTRIKEFECAWMNLADITTKHIADALDDLLVKSTPSVVINLRTRLHDVFRIAENKGLIKTGGNPVSAYKPPKYEVKRERLSLDQFQAIRAGVPGWAQHGMDLALMTGQRVSDVVNMRFSDYKDGALFIVQGKTGYKLQQDGQISLKSLSMSIDAAVKQCRNRTISKSLIHHTRNSGAYKAGDKVTASGLSAAFAAGRDAIGITAIEGKTPPTFHEIRSLSERLYRKEYGQDFSQAIMGHKHPRQTAEYNDLRGAGWAIVKAVK